MLLVISFIGLTEAIRLISNLDPTMVYDSIGPGYYILFISLALMITGVVHIAVNYKKISSAAKVKVDAVLRRRLISMILVLVFYTLAMDFLGYLISTFLFFLLEFRIGGIQSWRTNIILTIVLTTSYYVVFVKYFNMVFPRGIF